MPAGLNPLLGRFAATVEDANDRIADLVAADYALEGMGTTVTGAVFDGQRIGLVHIGDSRAYLLRAGRLERLTHDHSWVQSLVDDGKISPDEAAYHPHRSLLLKVLNGQPANDPDLTTVELQAGDRLLFCSDGLCGLVDDPRIGRARRSSRPRGGRHRAGRCGPRRRRDRQHHRDPGRGRTRRRLGGHPPMARLGRSTAEDEDTAVRPVVAATVVLGAAAERDIPVGPSALFAGARS